MFRACIVLSILSGIVLSASPLLAETRGVALLLRGDKEKGTLVTIHSDVPAEKKKDIPLDEALKIVKQMTGWGSVVMVCIVADDVNHIRTTKGPTAGLTLGNLRKLLKAVDENPWLSLTYLRIGGAKSGDDMVRHIIKATTRR